MISLLVPTMNRSDFVIRLLRYYHALGFEGRILIGDSSNKEHISRTKEAIKIYQTKSNIVHQEYPGLNNAQCMQLLLENVFTPYSAFLGDDDLLTPNGLNQCISFLERTADYSAAHGKAILFRLATPGPYGSVELTGYYKQPEITDDRPSRRLISFLNRAGVTQFSVHRTDVLRAMYKDVSAIRDMSLATEVLPCCLSVIYGKNKELNCLYLARQLHTQQYVYVGDPFDWITSPGWAESYNTFRDILARELVKTEGIELEQAKAIVKRAYSYNLIQILTKKWKSKYDNSSIAQSRLANVVARLLRGEFSTLRSQFSLSSLLHRSSPYHADFLPIYEILTGPPTAG